MSHRVEELQITIDSFDDRLLVVKGLRVLLSQLIDFCQMYRAAGDENGLADCENRCERISSLAKDLLGSIYEEWATLAQELILEINSANAKISMATEELKKDISRVNQLQNVLAIADGVLQLFGR